MTLLSAIFSVKSSRACHFASIAGPTRGAVAFAIFWVACQRIATIAPLAASFSIESLWAVEFAIVACVSHFAVAFAVDVVTTAAMKAKTSLGAIHSKETRRTLAFTMNTFVSMCTRASSRHMVARGTILARAQL